MKLADIITMEYSKFMFKYKNKMLPSSFNNHSTELEKIHSHNILEEWFWRIFSQVL